MLHGRRHRRRHVEGGRIQDCPERDMYRAIFSNFLKANMNFIRDTRAAEEEIPKNRAKLTEMMEMALTALSAANAFPRPPGSLIRK